MMTRIINFCRCLFKGHKYSRSLGLSLDGSVHIQHHCMRCGKKIVTRTLLEIGD